MRSRFPFFALAFLFLAMMLATLFSTQTATAGLSKGVGQGEALAALSYGRILAGAPENKVETTESEGVLTMSDNVLSSDGAGGTVVFASTRQGTFNIFSQAVGGDAQVEISSSGNDATPVWSPDGTRLLFASDRDGDFEIYLRQANDVEIQLTFNNIEDIHPSWSPDGSRIIFSSNRVGSYFQAYSMNSAGGDLQRHGEIDNHVLYPRLSPEGDRIVFMRASLFLPACDWNWDIWLMNADGSEQLKVTSQLGGDLYPNWTPDGRIIYASCRNFFTSDLYIVDPATGVESLITNWSGSEMHGVFSPNGEQLVFNANTTGNDEIYVATMADGIAFNLSNDANIDLTPSWFVTGQYAVSGTVTDINGVPLPDVIISTETGHQTTTNSDGSFSLSNLSPGAHVLRAAKNGYAFTPAVLTISGPPDAENQDFVGRNCTKATAEQPVMLVTGWSGSEGKLTIDADEQLKYFVDFGSGLSSHAGHITSRGYVEGCNLFYATDTSPYRYQYSDLLSPDGRSNATVIRDNLCAAFPIVAQVIPGWTGSFDLIGHSYGGLRSRAYLESSDLYRRDWQTGDVGTVCPGSFSRLSIRNLYTMGTPHGGEWPILPFSLAIGLGAILGEEPGFQPEIPAFIEMIPPVREVQNITHAQPPGVTYYFIGGDARAQVASSPTPLTLIYNLWTPAQLRGNDFAVHTSNINALLPYFLQYPAVFLAETVDLHGQVPWVLDPLGELRSYVNPSTTFEELICPQLFGSNSCPANGTAFFEPFSGYRETLAGEEGGSINLAEVHEVPAVPLKEIQAGVLSNGAVETGQFTLNGTGSSAILLAWPDGTLDLSLEDPDGKLIDAQSAESDANVDYLQFSDGFGLTTSYNMTTTVSGTWTYTVTSSSLTEPVGYRLVAIPPVPLAVMAANPLWVANGAPAVITATVAYDGSLPVMGGVVTMSVRRPDEVSETITLYDDGNNQDGEANDGVFGTVYDQTSLGGVYSLVFTATGSYDAVPYERSAVSYFTVAPATAGLNGTYNDRGVSNNAVGLYEQLEVSAEVTVINEGLYRLSANLYAGETFITQATTQLHLTPGTQTVPLLFDGVVIRESQLNGPYMIKDGMLIDESEVTLLIEAVDTAYTTGNYLFTQFGIPVKLNLPVVVKN